MKARSSLCMILIGATACVAWMAGCKTEHHIIVDPITLNINLKLDDELEQAFGYQERIEEQLSETATTVPQSAPASQGGDS